MNLCNMWPLVIGFFSLNVMFSRSTYGGTCISTSFLFFLPNNIALYGYATFYLTIHGLLDIWFVSTFWLL